MRHKTNAAGAVFVLVLVLLYMAAFQGCATREKVLKAKDIEGIAVVYPVTEQQAWELAKTVFRWNKAGKIREYPGSKFLYSETKGVEWDSWGAVMGAWIEPVDASSTKVTVVVKRRLATTIATPFTEGMFHKDFAFAVECVKKGRELPPASPHRK